MRYWLLTSEYPPFFGGGISTYCKITAGMMQQKNHEVTVFVNDNTVREVKEDMVNGIRVVRFNPIRTESSDFLGHVTNISYEFAIIIRDYIEREGKPDLIESQEYLGIAYYLLQFKHLQYDWCKDIPVLITMHSPSFLYMEYNHVPMYRYPNYWICEMERFCLQAANHIISPSQFMVDELFKRFKLTNSELSIIPNPFSIDQSVMDKNSVDKPDQIVFYGKLTAQKGAFQLLKYFQELWDDEFNEPLYLIGGQDIVYHPEKVTMGDLIRKKYGKYIQKGLLRLESKVLPSEIGTRLSKAKVVIVPSNNDNLPYVVFEMMALGKILLVSKQGGHREVIRQEREGFIFDHEMPESFRAQLIKILQLDERERTNIAERAVRRVKEDYSCENIYEKKIKVLEALTTGSKRERELFPYVRNEAVINSSKNKGSYVEGRISIVIPYFNLGQFIDATIQSILQSNYADKEIIIVNDGSTEVLSIEKLNQYRNHPNILVVDKANAGLASSRNYGAGMASGEFLAFLDADDTVETSYYSKAIKAIKKFNNIHFAGCWVQYIGDSKNKWPAFMPEAPLILYHNMINSSALVYRRDSFIHAGMNNINMTFAGWEDYDSVISLTEKGLNGVVLPEILFNYRIRHNSMVRELSREKKLILYQDLCDKHSDIYSKFAPDLFNLLNANGTGVYLDNPSLDLHLADKIPFGGNLSMKIIKLIKRNKYIKPIAYKIYRLLNK